MNLSSLTDEEFSLRLSRSELSVDVGPFSISLQSNLDSFSHGLRSLYRHFPIGSGSFSDFHLSVNGSSGLRRWWRPQANFYMDDVKPFKPLPFGQALPMFEWGLNWCITTHCHEYLIVHAAVVEKNGSALLLSAPPGAGKSTLCAALVCRGWRLLSDELALLSLESAGDVIPLARPVCLKNSSIDIMRQFAPSADFGPLSFDTAKGTVAHMVSPRESVERVGEVARLKWVVFPRYIPKASTRLTEKSKAHTFLDVAKQAFNFHVLAQDGFDLLNRGITDADCYDFQYSSLDEAVALFDRMADDTLG